MSDAAEYWSSRELYNYYQTVRELLESEKGESLLDVGACDTPVVTWGDFKFRAAVDPSFKGVDRARGVQYFEEDFMVLADGFPTYDVVTCLQVLEHLPVDVVRPFTRKLFETAAQTVIISVPYKWPKGRCEWHVHDPVCEWKLRRWTGRFPNRSWVIDDNGCARLVACYDVTNPVNEQEVGIYPDWSGRLDVSIIVSAFRASGFLEDCLDSLCSQVYGDQWEVVLGIDGCPDTLAKFERIRGKYSNVRAFWFPENSGTYATSNSLYEEAAFNTLLRFDADDIMLPDMLQSLKSRSLSDGGSVEMYTFSADMFNEEGSLPSINWSSEGQIAFTSHLFERLGGWRDWVCSADAEFIGRAESGGAIRGVLEDVTYRKRCHGDSLTVHPSTGMGSDVRNYYKSVTSRRFEKVDRVTHSRIEI